MNFQTPSHSSILRLITIGVSHYCEKARWGLDWLQIPYHEESHMPPFHRFITPWYGGGSVPVLGTSTESFIDSTDILHYADAIATSSRRLYPSDPQLRCHVNDLETWFDIQLGIATRCWGYALVIDNRQLVKQLWLQQANGFGKLAFELIYPYMRQKVRQVYSTTPEEAASALQKIRRIFDEVGDWLAPGQDYLVGDRFTAADLTFAALAAPVLLPAEYGARLPQLDQLPSEMATTIQSLRETPAGDYGLRLYREHRCGPKEKKHTGQRQLTGGAVAA